MEPLYGYLHQEVTKSTDNENDVTCNFGLNFAELFCTGCSRLHRN